MAHGRQVLRGTGRAIACLFISVAILHTLWPGHYQFPEARPFEGRHWYEPYAGFDFGTALRANLHGHSQLIPGLTYGTHSPAEVRARYRELGYDVYPLTNYQSISPAGADEAIYLPAYEHGYGWPTGRHYTLLGAERVRWLDYPFFQHVFAKQHVIETLLPSAELLVLNHPQRKGAFHPADLRRLAGLHGIELRSKYARGEAHWDAALSAGRLLWGFCSDDQHDLDGRSPAGIGWVWVDAAAPTPEAVLEALHRGAFYSVFSRRNGPPNRVEGVELRDGVLRVRLVEPAERLRFVGQDGRVLAESSGRREARYAPTPADPYVRFQAETHGTELFLNPIFRHGEGDPLTRARARRSASVTFAMRGLALLAIATTAWLLFRRRGSA